ncbi:hypothetical protein ABEB36_004221 [Hypothenemus hampei]|uniref:serine--tRNA ligase n=1 Tax=Hypothenemus hampei TaxID=57062 RepID=A0ABD1F2M7_HYPHA
MLFINSLKVIKPKLCIRRLQTSNQQGWDVPTAIHLDKDFLFNPKNIPLIESNIKSRKSMGNIRLLNELYQKLSQLNPSDISYEEVKGLFNEECRLIPNSTHPDVFEYGDEPKIVKYIGAKRKFDFPHKEFSEIGKRLNLVRTEQLGNLTGNRSYYLLGQMAELEQALIRCFVGDLIKNNFQLLSVPDILPRTIVESCGMNTRGERAQVYTLDPKIHPADLCLSGTSELALAGYLANQLIDETELPLKLCSVSRCYRAETSSTAEERGIFRVHEFTKVEMFVVSTPQQSDMILETIREQQEELFTALDIHFQVLDMPPHDLGAPAYRKYDIEAWMPGRNIYGEISSCSNCTDYQSRRLNIRYKDSNGKERFVHTLNGTACAIPRLLISLIETHQQNKGTVVIPEMLRKFMRDNEVIIRQKTIPELKLIKHKK